MCFVAKANVIHRITAFKPLQGNRKPDYNDKRHLAESTESQLSNRYKGTENLTTTTKGILLNPDSI
jgi:hypothetical protein